MNETKEGVILYYYEGKYYTLRRQVKVGRQYYCSLVEVEEQDLEDEDNG